MWAAHPATHDWNSRLVCVIYSRDCSAPCTVDCTIEYSSSRGAARGVTLCAALTNVRSAPLERRALGARHRLFAHAALLRLTLRLMQQPLVPPPLADAASPASPSRAQNNLSSRVKSLAYSNGQSSTHAAWRGFGGHEWSSEAVRLGFRGAIRAAPTSCQLEMANRRYEYIYDTHSSLFPGRSSIIHRPPIAECTCQLNSTLLYSALRHLRANANDARRATRRDALGVGDAECAAPKRTRAFPANS